jgi:hypothetical protein
LLFRTQSVMVRAPQKKYGMKSMLRGMTIGFPGPFQGSLI